MLRNRGPWLGQIPLVLGPSSWGRGIVPTQTVNLEGIPPYYGEWGIPASGGEIVDGGRVGPFDTIDEAFSAASKEAVKAGARKMPMDGYAQVKDSRGVPVGPVI